MIELAFTTYQGKRILVSSMSETEVGPAILGIDMLSAELRKHPDQSVLVLLDVTQGKIMNDVNDHWKRQVPIYDRHVKRAAVVGPALVRTIVSVVLIASRLGKYKLADRVKSFATLEEARDYLVKE